MSEMLSSPKMNEYLGVIAPPDKKALYMGYANIPIAIGWAYGAWFAGQIYESSGEKAGLALRYLERELHLAHLPGREAAFAKLMQETGWSASEATRRLWDAYEPSQVWTPFVISLVGAAVAIFVFNMFAKRWKDVNA